MRKIVYSVLIIFILPFLMSYTKNSEKISKSFATFIPATFYQGASIARCNDAGGCLIDIAVVSRKGGEGILYRFKGEMVSFRDFKAELGPVNVIVNE